jgi:hypothetical protein
MTKNVWHAMESADVFNELGTDIDRGLTEKEIEKRLMNMVITN